MTKKRAFTQAELDASERLKRIWNDKKRELKLTQEKVAQLCDLGNQSAFGAYLHARVPLNTEAVLKLARALQVYPTKIMLELESLLPQGVKQPKGIYEAKEERRDALQQIQSNYQAPQGLHDLATDQALIDAMKITDDEFCILGTIELPDTVSKNDYLQLLITIRAITDK